ncbi:MAG: RIO1 family regulatory kinase/ATPase [Methanomassiliicoccales archaeon]
MVTVLEFLRRESGEDLRLKGLPAGEKEIRFIRRLPSKKNAVHLLVTGEGDLVAKVFLVDRARHEYQVLLRLLEAGVRVPRPYLREGRVLLMEHVEGENMVDLLNRTLDDRCARALAGWFASLHLSFLEGERTLIKSDSKLKNFIWNDGVVGVDFEMAREGSPVEDIGEVCSQILDTDPMFTPDKYRLCWELLDEYVALTGIGLIGLNDSIVQSLREAARFRPAQGELLLSKAEELRGRGEFDR